LNYKNPWNVEQTALIEISDSIVTHKFAKRLIAVKITQILLDAGANPNIIDRNGVTALSNAAAKSYIQESKEMMKALLRAGAKPDLGNTLDDEPYVTKLTKNLVGANKYFMGSENQLSNMQEMLEMLVGAGADPELKGKSGKSARDYAIEYKRPDLVQLFDEAIAKRKRDTELKKFTAQKK
jgi:ankyrin repeat protein